MEKPLRTFFLEGAKEYLDEIPDADKGAIARDIEGIAANEIAGATTKQLKGPIRELKSGPHRITYFKLGGALYFVRGFRKKSARTPKREIDHAHKIFNILKSELWNQ